MGPELVAPLQDMSKVEIALEAARLGLRSDDTWSCYQPRAEETAARACGVCDACILHDTAWRAVEQRERRGAEPTAGARNQV
jgi:7-cyano-7-deazaguanine synthase in queuosine biosynthesis